MLFINHLQFCFVVPTPCIADSPRSCFLLLSIDYLTVLVSLVEASLFFFSPCTPCTGRNISPRRIHDIRFRNIHEVLVSGVAYLYIGCDMNASKNGEAHCSSRDCC